MPITLGADLLKDCHIHCHAEFALQSVSDLTCVNGPRVNREWGCYPWKGDLE